MNETELERSLKERCMRYETEISRLSAENSRKDAAIELAWEALRWTDSAIEGDPDDPWTEIPRDKAIAAFNAICDERVSTEQKRDGDRQT